MQTSHTAERREVSSGFIFSVSPKHLCFYYYYIFIIIGLFTCCTFETLVQGKSAGLQNRVRGFASSRERSLFTFLNTFSLLLFFCFDICKFTKSTCVIYLYNIWLLSKIRISNKKNITLFPKLGTKKL